MGQSLRDLWKINSDIYLSTQSEKGGLAHTCISAVLNQHSSERAGAHPLRCVYFPQKVREKGEENREKEKKKMGPEKLADLWPFKWPPPTSPSLWSLNPNGKRPFHVGTRGALAATPPSNPHLPQITPKSSFVAETPTERCSAIKKQYTLTCIPAKQSGNSLAVSNSM